MLQGQLETYVVGRCPEATEGSLGPRMEVPGRCLTSRDLEEKDFLIEILIVITVGSHTGVRNSTRFPQWYYFAKL